MGPEANRSYDNDLRQPLVTILPLRQDQAF